MFELINHSLWITSFWGIHTYVAIFKNGCELPKKKKKKKKKDNLTVIKNNIYYILLDNILMVFILMRLSLEDWDVRDM